MVDLKDTATGSKNVVLRTIQKQDHELVLDWMTKKENYQWFDFGGGRQLLPRQALLMMFNSSLNYVRLYCESSDNTPIGILGINGITETFRTGNIWAIRGNFDEGSADITKTAVSLMVLNGFTIKKLNSIAAWAVETNVKSLAVMKKLGFRYIGRQRKCHIIDGIALDRLHYDVLPGDLKVSEEVKKAFAFQQANHTAETA